MEYYGYFPTFNYLVVETQIIVTLIGFIALFFIFWYRYTYESEMPNGDKNTKKYNKQLKTHQKKLSIGTFAFLIIMIFGIFIVLENISILQTFPYNFEHFTAQNIPIPDFMWNRLESTHPRFIIWIFSSLFYIMILTITIIGVFKEEQEKIETKKEDEKKGKQTYVEKIRKIFGGR